MALEAFPLPLAARRQGSQVVALGARRPARVRRRSRSQYRSPRGRLPPSWPTVTDVGVRLVASAHDGYREGRRYRVAWPAPDGTTQTSPAMRAYVSRE